MVLYDSFYSLHHVILHERYIACRYCWIKWPVDPMVEKPQIAILINGLWALFQPMILRRTFETSRRSAAGVGQNWGVLTLVGQNWGVLTLVGQNWGV